MGDSDSQAVYRKSYTLRVSSVIGNVRRSNGVPFIANWSERISREISLSDDNGVYVEGNRKTCYDSVVYEAEPDYSEIKKSLDISDFKRMGCPLELTAESVTTFSVKPNGERSSE